jgi:hypothetical protein
MALDAEYSLNGPFNSVYKLQTLVNGAKTPGAIEWTLTSLSDALKMGFLELGDFSNSKLKGWVLELHMMKFKMHSYFLTVFLDSHPFPSAAKQKLRNIFADHASVRQQLTNYPEDGGVQSHEHLGRDVHTRSWSCLQT